jgi:hypothetical protein
MLVQIGTLDFDFEGLDACAFRDFDPGIPRTTEFRNACSIESMRKCIAPIWPASSRAIIVFPAAGSPPKVISTGTADRVFRA